MPNLCIIPASALQDEILTGTDIRVLCAVGMHTDRNGVGCFASSRTLADEARVSRNQFFESTKRLIERGYIERDSGQESGKPSRYAIIFPRLSKEGIPNSGTGEESQNSIHRSPRKEDASTINASINEASGLGQRFERNQLSDVNLYLSRVPSPARTAWIAEIGAMLDGMAGHVHAAPVAIAKACRDATANGKSLEPNMRQFRRYVADAVEETKAAPDVKERAKKFWHSIMIRGTLHAQTKDTALVDFQRAAECFEIDMSGEDALALFLKLDRKLLRTATETVAINHIAERMAA